MGRPGFRSFESLLWLPDGAKVPPAAVLTRPIGGFRSFQAMLFLPDAANFAGGAVTPTVSGGRKLISPAFAKTLTAEFT